MQNFCKILHNTVVKSWKERGVRVEWEKGGKNRRKENEYYKSWLLPKPTDEGEGC